MDEHDLCRGVHRLSRVGTDQRRTRREDGRAKGRNSRRGANGDDDRHDVIALGNLETQTRRPDGGAHRPLALVHERQRGGMGHQRGGPRADAKSSAFVYGVYNGILNLMGAFSNIIVTWIAKRYGFIWAFSSVVVFMAIFLFGLIVVIDGKGIVPAKEELIELG